MTLIWEFWKRKLRKKKIHKWKINGEQKHIDEKKNIRDNTNRCKRRTAMTGEIVSENCLCDVQFTAIIPYYTLHYTHIVIIMVLVAPVICKQSDAHAFTTTSTCTNEWNIEKQQQQP